MRQGHYCGIIDVGLQWACGGYLYRRAGRIYAEQGFDKIRHNAQLLDMRIDCVFAVESRKGFAFDNGALI